ncbi:MAG: tRNA (adenosine(37)-N6)-threonylcarbamoyltransferase complex ATPase subunit type 1 TsaE [Bacteroidetes bacterium]|nr:tRNA (adenosine(37)-N6)-threonylcarbamoyltransferase complex ATPase subunit type 1 TsaE [Bacteroidota bacterium]
MKKEFYTVTPEETRAVANTFASQLKRGDIVALYGDLGTGKTQFVKGICEAFGATSVVISPTFVVYTRYEGKDRSGKPLWINHLDLYRFQSALELYELGYEEILYSDGISCIEWAERCNDVLPLYRYEVHFLFGKNESERIIRIEQLQER